MRWAGYATYRGKKRNAYGILLGMSEGKRPLGLCIRRREDNIKIYLKEVRLD
jgi:hypothetical protein